jgi:hypothetical protein
MANATNTPTNTTNTPNTPNIPMKAQTKPPAKSQAAMPAGSPAWWTDQHSSRWDDVKGALERDWEQTKSDLSQGAGHQLNQGLADTLKQAVGAEHVPPLGVQTHADAVTLTPAQEAAQQARAQMEKASAKAGEAEAKARAEIAQQKLDLDAKVASVGKELSEDEAKANRKTADNLIAASQASVDLKAAASADINKAQLAAADATAKEQRKIEAARASRGEAVGKWHEAEREVRYGYSVRSQFPAMHPWDDQLEQRLEKEWDVLTPSHPWSLAKDRIRRGWDYASRAP